MKKKEKVKPVKSVIILPLCLATLPAFGHGWVVSPPSRQQLCAANQAGFDCGNVRYEPQSVEGPKGAMSCSGGSSFSILDSNAYWPATRIGTSTDVVWKYTAPHRTANWQYFINGQLIASVDGGHGPASNIPVHTLHNLPHGRHTILGIWNVGDTVNAFYNCIDVEVGNHEGRAEAAAEPEAAAPVAVTGGNFESLISEGSFNSLFPNRDGFYSYQGIAAAANATPGFVKTGDDTMKKRELAAFLANVAHETGDLRYIVELNQANWDHYCDTGNTTYPCAPGKQYYGRGPIQLSWNYNYGAAGDAIGVDLRNNPDLVARDSKIAWQTGMWYWTTQRGRGQYTPHEAITQSAGFGQTIRAINGGLECDGMNPAQAQSRINNYHRLLGVFGVSSGSGSDGC